MPVGGVHFWDKAFADLRAVSYTLPFLSSSSELV
jgi:hypothetical protein